MAQLLIEDNFNDVECLVESVGAQKKYKIHGVFAQTEKKNKNGRVYSGAIMEREVNRYRDNYISKKRAVGELNHPDTPSINLDRVSHLITDLVKDGNNYIGTAEIIDTPCGITVQRLLDAGVQLGVSTRGVGSLKPANGYQMVGEDFFLATIDIVADPSAPDAFVSALRESQEWVIEHGVWSEKIRNKYKKMLDEATKEDYDRIKLRAFGSYLSNLQIF